MATIIIITTTSDHEGFMASHDVEVAIIGGGAAGIAATRRLHDAGVRCLMIEARARLGGRAWSVTDTSGFALDLGCGWLHSAERNPWSDIAKAQGRTIDKTPPPWMRRSSPVGFPIAEQQEYLKAGRAFYERLEHAERLPDQPAAAFLTPGDRWNNLITAVNTFVTGAELTHVSAHDLVRYEDSDENWRVVEGLGATVAAHGAGLPAVFGCPVTCINRDGPRLRAETSQGAITADQIIIAVPAPILTEPEFFAPALPQKVEAALGLPLGQDDKLFLSLEDAAEFDKDSRLFGRTDRVGTAAYHMRPFGRPMIEAYFGGSLAADLEAGGDAAFFDFATAELTALLGNGFRARIKPLGVHRWGADPFSRGAYSYALPGKAEMRAVLSAPVEDRLFFAGEACSLHDFSTVHGALLTGIAAAEQILAMRTK